LEAQVAVRIDLAGIQLPIIRPNLLQQKLDKITAKGQVPIVEFVVCHSD
jgi:hypothetical protein